MDKLIITTVQTDLHWENKRANLEMLGNKIMGIREKTNIVVLPEMFSTGFTMQPELLAEKMDGETVSWMRNLAREKGIILAGSLSIEEEGEYYNRFIWMLPNGQHGHYDKRHCFSLGGEDQHYAPGTEYDLMINVANWPERRIHHWKTLLQARAIENQCFVVGVNRVGNDGNGLYHSGDSMVIDPLGQILYHKSQEEDVHTTILEKSQLDEVRTRLPFWKDGDHFLLV